MCNPLTPKNQVPTYPLSQKSTATENISNHDYPPLSCLIQEKLTQSTSSESESYSYYGGFHGVKIPSKFVNFFLKADNPFFKIRFFLKQ